jgi:hypothetical protein
LVEVRRRHFAGVARSIQLRGRHGIWLLLFKHLQRGIEGVAQVRGSEGTAPDATDSNELHFHAAPSQRVQCAGSNFHLYRPSQDAVGWCHIKVDEGDRVQVNVFGPGGSFGSLWISQLRISS